MSKSEHWTERDAIERLADVAASELATMRNIPWGWGEHCLVSNIETGHIDGRTGKSYIGWQSRIRLWWNDLPVSPTGSAILIGIYIILRIGGWR